MNLYFKRQNTKSYLQQLIKGKTAIRVHWLLSQTAFDNALNQLLDKEFN